MASNTSAIEAMNNGGLNALRAQLAAAAVAKPVPIQEAFLAGAEALPVTIGDADLPEDLAAQAFDPGALGWVGSRQKVTIQGFPCIVDVRVYVVDSKKAVNAQRTEMGIVIPKR